MTLQEVSSPPAPQARSERPRWRRWVSADVVYFVAVAVALVSVSVAATSAAPALLRIGSGALALALGVVGGVQIAMTVSAWWSRVVSFTVPILGVAMTGFLMFVLYQRNDGYPLAQIGLVLLLFATVRGLHHLLVLRPRVRLVASLSVLTVMVAASAAGARILIGMMSSDLGMPLARVAVPSWLVPLAGILLFSYLAIAVLLVAAVWGWFEYIGVSAAFRNAPDMLGIFSGALVIVMVLFAFIAAVGQAEQLYASWLDTFESDQTPGMTSDFMYRACVNGDLVEAGHGSGYPAVLPSEHPVVVVEAVDGPGWVWDPVRLSQGQALETLPLDTSVHEVRPVADGVTSCAANA